MKIERLIGILSILLQQDKVTAPSLAERFEVSRRTINRDIEELCRAGIPITTTQGQNGGISIMEGYRVDRTLLTSAEMQAILAGLRSLDSVSGTNRYQVLMEKLSLGSSNILTSNSHIVIDLSAWHGKTLAPRIEFIQAAVERRERLSFTYYGPRGEGERVMEPYLLVFHWSSWYVWGYCMERQDYRMFKLLRMENVRGTGDIFPPRALPPFAIDESRIYPRTLEASVVVDASLKWRMIEECGADCFTETDGRLVVKTKFVDKESLFMWLLSLGSQAELAEPLKLRMEYKEIVKEIYEKYL